MQRLQLLPILVALTTATAAQDPANAFDPARLPAPITDADYYDDGAPAPEKVELGRMLFFDKLLSGNRNISCATCHHPDLAGGDGVALSFGEGPRGLGPDRSPGASAEEAVYERVPRNSPALFNVGAREFTRLFHDGRVEADPEDFYSGGFITPAKWKLPLGLDNVLAAQALFPVGSPTEMAGQKGENELADAKSLNRLAGPSGLWAGLAARLQANSEYVELFQRAYPDRVRTPVDITYVLAANAIAAFETKAFRSDQSPFDRFLRGEAELAPPARRGMELFYGRAGCFDCHGGKFQTDHDFHAIAMPQIGPGKSDGWNPDYWRATGLKAFPEDFGRGRVTRRNEDNYRFRTPSLRNVEHTGPWGHDGAYDTLEAVVRHHLDPIAALESYRLPETALPDLEGVLEQTASGSRLSRGWLAETRLAGYLRRDTWVQSHPELRANLAAANQLDPVDLTDGEVQDLLAFLRSLSDPGIGELGNWLPTQVPSNLPLAD